MRDQNVNNVLLKGPVIILTLIYEIMNATLRLL